MSCALPRCGRCLPGHVLAGALSGTPSLEFSSAFSQFETFCRRFSVHFRCRFFLLRTAAQSFFGPFAFSLSVLSMPKKPKARRCFTAGLVFTIPGFVLFRFLRAHRPRPPLFSGAPPPLRRAANDAAEGCLLHDFEDVCSKKGSFRVASRRIGCQYDSAFSPEWNSRGNERIQM